MGAGSASVWNSSSSSNISDIVFQTISATFSNYPTARIVTDDTKILLVFLFCFVFFSFIFVSLCKSHGKDNTNNYTKCCLFCVTHILSLSSSLFPCLFVYMHILFKRCKSTKNTPPTSSNTLIWDVDGWKKELLTLLLTLKSHSVGKYASKQAMNIFICTLRLHIQLVNGVSFLWIKSMIHYGVHIIYTLHSS